MLLCGNKILLTEFLDVENFSSLAPLSLLVFCKFSFPVVSLNMFSLATLVFKYNRIFLWYWIFWVHVPIPHRSSPSHQFYLLLGWECRGQWYGTSDLLVLCMTFCSADMIFFMHKKNCILLLFLCHCPPILPPAYHMNLLWSDNYITKDEIFWKEKRIFKSALAEQFAFYL
jgi:hypothetical protein